MSREYRPGEIVTYPYLWAWQQDRGETEGRKERPVCVVVAVRSDRGGLTHLALLAITSQPPRADRLTLEIPEMECRRAGLSDLKRAWIVVDEYNYDIAERSYYLEPGQDSLGRFSKPFMMRVAATFFESTRRSGHRINRVD
ncbi:hypothetical protein [Rhizobium sp. 007]|uniref:hypothetical protein n=1 Tax=Rhizobium sp. 007 TaxID=2785056 RepID=UPI00188E6EA0|nr:hypothetical protein [Rhizobium sp. 007]QPB18786.1 hypothetical protein ISN39_14175 [Rhizobium sp. 007]